MPFRRQNHDPRCRPLRRPLRRPQCRALLLLLLLAPPAAPVPAQVVINEYQASNVAWVRDEDGDTPDWVELYNCGSEPVDLAGFGLTDRASKPHKWVFPSVILPAKGHLLVYASGKDRREWLPHWETVIDWGDEWRYRVNHDAPPDRWWEPGFDDSGWLSGPTGIGRSDGDDATVVDTCVSVGLRTGVRVIDREHVRWACLHVDYDDGFVAWLNGVEIARACIGTPGVPPRWNSPAVLFHEAQLYRGGDAEYFPIAGYDSILVDGENVLAVSVHNGDPDKEDMSIIPFLTLGYDQPPVGAVGAAERIRLYLPHLHANFKVDNGNEEVFLYDAGGVLVDRTDDRFVPADYSCGRFPDGGDTWMFFSAPTPEAPNTIGGDDDFAVAPDFSLPGGRYQGPQLTVAISSSRPGATITYTTDGSDPQDGSTPYTDPLTIESTRVVRARTFEPGRAPSLISTQSYILDDETPLAIVSLVTDPPNLWDYETGIYVMGPYAQPDYPYHEANFWMDWERPAHAEFFPPEGQGFSVLLGIKIHGGTTRALPQKSFRLITRGGYGPTEMACQVFPEKPTQVYRRLILRNAGNDWCLTHMRDGFVHNLAARIGLDHQAYRPVHTYLNGVYWGVYNIRELIDAYYLADNHGIDPGSIDLLELNAEVMEGSAEQYNDLLGYLHTHDLADDEAFAYVTERMDVENYADYVILRVFCANTDWPANNLRYWRSDELDGKWRWIIYDTELGLGLNRYGAQDRTLAWALAPNSGAWQNAPWSTFLLRSLLRNHDFCVFFINRYADLLNTLLSPQSTLALWDQMSATIAGEMPRQFQRWGRSLDIWDEQNDITRGFLRQRPAIARAHLMAQFDLTDTLRVSLDIDPPGGGSIRLGSVTVDSCWTGVYFRGLPLTLTAVPAAGYGFLGWSDTALPADSTVQINPDGDYAVTARFVPILPKGQVWQLVAPNPVQSEAIFTLRLNQPRNLELTVFDLLGRRVSSLAGGHFEPGEYPLMWAARRDNGQLLPSGVYFLTLTSDAHRTTHRLIVVR
jgi:hypothetical protein